MLRVLHFRKELREPPAVVVNNTVRVRALAIPEDLPAWLAMRERAVTGQSPAVRTWVQADFLAEMIGKPWWRADRSWVAVPAESLNTIIGAVTLAVRNGAAGSVPVVHWLLVEPEWRRRGVGRLLMSQLELAAWNNGWREVQLESHAGWTAAAAFYQSMGYARLRAEPPR